MDLLDFMRLSTESWLGRRSLLPALCKNNSVYYQKNISLTSSRWWEEHLKKLMKRGNKNEIHKWRTRKRNPYTLYIGICKQWNITKEMANIWIISCFLVSTSLLFLLRPTPNIAWRFIYSLFRCNFIVKNHKKRLTIQRTSFWARREIRTFV